MSDDKTEHGKIAHRSRKPISYPASNIEEDYLDAYVYGYDHEAESNRFRLRNIWRAVRKHKWLVTIFPILVTLLVTVEVNRPNPIFESSAIVELKKDTWVMVKSGDSVIEEEADTALSSPSVKTNTLMLKSRPLLQDVAIKLELEREPRFFDITKKKKSYLNTLKSLTPIANGEEHSRAQEHAQRNKVSGVKRAEADESAGQPEQEESMSDERKATLTGYVNVLRDNLNIEPIKDTRALKISFIHTSPDLAAEIANGIAESFIERSFQNKTAKFNRATAWLERTTRDLKSKVQKAEQALADYTGDHNIYAPDAKDTMSSDKLTRLHAEVLRAETDRMLKESLYEEVKAGRLAQLPEAFADPRTAALQAQMGQLSVQAAQLDVSFGPKFPQVVEVKRQIAAIEEQIEASRKALEEKLKAEYGRAVRDEQTLKTAMELAKSEAVQQNKDSIQYSLLKQDAEMARSLYAQFLQKTNQANIQVAEQPANVRLIEPAEVPSYPITENRPLYILFGFLLSLAACVGLAFLLEHLGTNIKSVEDVNRYVQLHAIGVIPKIRPHQSRQLLARNGKQKQGATSLLGESSLGTGKVSFRPIISIDDSSVAVEAYRAVSTSVLLSSGDTPPKTVLITSGLPGEGKTTTVVNTAISLAQLGASVLIIDCDLRNPNCHKVFDLENSSGLSTYLSSNVGVEGLIRELEIPNLSLLTAGPIPQNPAKLIISRKMKSLLQTLGERYDHILIDSPPLIGVTDPIILSTVVDGVIVVVHGNKSTREIVRRARQELSNVGANIFGVVLNNIDLTDYQYYQPYYKYTQSNAQEA